MLPAVSLIRAAAAVEVLAAAVEAKVAVMAGMQSRAKWTVEVVEER